MEEDAPLLQRVSNRFPQHRAGHRHGLKKPPPSFYESKQCLLDAIILPTVGFTRIKVMVSNPAELTRWKEVEVLADSGALFTSLPRPLLEGLKLKPISRQRLKVYGGGVVERDIGGAVVEYRERRAAVPMVFGEPEDVSILGVTSLESLGYRINPVTRELEPIELLMI